MESPESKDRDIAPRHSDHFRLAEERDEPALREILEQGDFKGKISLRYTRRPHVLESLKREGSSVEVYYCQGGGFGASAVNIMEVNGVTGPVAYLFSFRLDRQRFSSLRHIIEGYRFHFQRMEAQNITQGFTTILEENTPAIRMLEKRRKSMPVYDFQGSLLTLTLKTGGPGRLPGGYTLTPLKREQIPEMLRFYHREISRYSFAPLLTEEDLLQGKHSPLYSSFRLLSDGRGNILAMGAIWDQRDYKQYEVMGYRGMYRLLQPVSPLLFPLLGYPPLPPAGSVLNMFSLAFCLSRKGDPAIFRAFIRAIKKDSRRFDCFSLGMFEKNPLLRELKRFPHISYKSRFYRVYPQGKEPQPLKKIPFIEIGRL